MIRLSDTTHKLQLALGATHTTNALPVSAHYSDQTASAYAGGSKLSVSNGTTDVDIVDAPAASAIRDVDYLSVYNRDTVQHTVVIKLDVSGTDYILTSVALNVGERLEYTHGEGLRIFSATGGVKTASDVAPLSIRYANYTGDGAEDTFSTGTTPANLQAVFAFQDGVQQDPSTYTLSGQNVVFNTAPASGVSVSLRVIETSGFIVPGVDTVNTAAIQDDAVTTAKIDDLAVTAAKLASDAVTTAKILDANVTPDKLSNTWTSYTPTLAVASGTLTSATASGRYIRIGKMVYLLLDVRITTNGTAAGSLSASLPVDVASTGIVTIAAGREYQAVGNMLQGLLSSGGSVMTILRYDNAYPGADGYRFAMTAFYEGV